MVQYPDYQVELSEPTPNKPTSLGLAKFQQAMPEKEPNLPLSPSLRGLAYSPGTNTKRPAGEGYQARLLVYSLPYATYHL